MTKFPTPQDGDRLESLMLGRYTATGGRIRIELFEGHEGMFYTIKGTISADRIVLETPRKGYVDVYQKTDFPPEAMHRLEPNW
jgi:hypothetical protein